MSLTIETLGSGPGVHTLETKWLLMAEDDTRQNRVPAVSRGDISSSRYNNPLLAGPASPDQLH